MTPPVEVKPTMRFGLPGRADMEHAAVADALGYDSLWFSEAHLSPALGNNPGQGRPLSPIVVAAAVAARTSRIRLGFSAMLVALRDPLSLAEDIATLDVISGGRVNLGIGWPNPLYAPLFSHGTMPDLEEILDAMIAYWEGRPILVEGADHRVEPVPVQRPHPPIHVAARSEETIAWAAKRGYALILNALLSPASLHRCLDIFAEHGGDPANAPTERYFLVAESDAEAQKLARPIVTNLVERFRPSGIAAQPNQIVGEIDLDIDHFLNESVLVGSPDTVARQVTELGDAYGLRRINLRPSFSGNCPADLQRTSIALFAREVLPRLGAEPANNTNVEQPV